jgi:hypothetical protein
MTTLPGESMRRVCRVLKFSRARLRARAVITKVARLDEVLAGRIRRLIELYPTFGLPAAMGIAPLWRRDSSKSQGRISNTQTEKVV